MTTFNLETVSLRNKFFLSTLFNLSSDALRKHSYISQKLNSFLHYLSIHQDLNDWQVIRQKLCVQIIKMGKIDRMKRVHIQFKVYNKEFGIITSQDVMLTEFLSYHTQYGNENVMNKVLNLILINEWVLKKDRKFMLRIP